VTELLAMEREIVSAMLACLEREIPVTALVKNSPALVHTDMKNPFLGPGVM